MASGKSDWGIKVRVWVERAGVKVLGPGRVELLEHIDRQRSISAAARQMGMSYRRAWELVQAMNEAAGVELVEAKPGGSGGGGAAVTAHGQEAIRLYHSLVASFAKTSQDVALPAEPLAAPPDTT
ncbi:MAG: LysR family transcriptional regulator [Planctomycetes bacterium]|nr:LysR family transcriptional regulator [Planctomycetota bacterium]